MLTVFALSLALLGAEPGSAAPEPEYRFGLEGSSTELGLSGEGRLRITIHPRADKKLNLKAPFEVILGGEGVQLDKERLGPEDAVAKTSSVGLEIGFRGTRPGPAALDVKARFFICDDRVCERRVEIRRLPVIVRGEGPGR